jgi:hypothetical protein
MNAEGPAPLHADARVLARKARHQDASEALANDGVARTRLGYNVPVKIKMGELIELALMRTKEKLCPPAGILPSPDGEGPIQAADDACVHTGEREGRVRVGREGARSPSRQRGRAWIRAERFVYGPLALYAQLDVH